VVVPCHNEELNIKKFIQRIIPSIKKLNLNNFVLVFIDDGSTDKTWEKIIEQIKIYDKIIGIKLTRNFGHQSALTAGLNEIEAENYLIIDADCQDPPELIFEFKKILDQNLNIDVVYGKRKKRLGESKFKKTSAKIYYYLLNLISEIEIPVDTGDFRLIRKKVRDKYIELPESVRYARGLFVWLGFNAVAFEYERNSREFGKSSYNFTKMLGLAVSGIVGFSIKPLRYATYLGLFGFFMSIILFLYFIYSTLFFDVEPGW